MKSLTQNIDRLDALLLTHRYGRSCRWFDAVESTNSLALSLAKQDADAGSLIVADFQKRGRGRFKRSWTADPGKNLTFSLILDWEGLRSHLGLLPVALGVAVVEALSDAVEPHRPLIKWPNDVVLAGRKVCGILIESSLPSHGQQPGGCVVAGIGINVNQETFPPEIADAATSIFQVLGRPTDRIALLADVLLAVETTLGRLAAGKTASIVQRYESMMAGLGKTASFHYVDSDQTNEGTVLGIDDAGGLRVRMQDGVKVLRAGEVTFKDERRVHARVARVTDRPSPASSS